MGDFTAFYATHGPMSQLPDGVTSGDIPSDLAEMRSVVQGLLVHRDWVKTYGLTDDDVRLDEQNIRAVRDVVDRAFTLSPDPLAQPREPRRRVQGICRHFALLHVAFLRAHGVPARMRCGFASYFDQTDKWYDHWITERWDDKRWVRDDPQIDSMQSSVIKPDFDVNDQPAGRFLSADEAWIATRAGEFDPTCFGIFDMWGAGFIAGNVVSDFACLNRMEMLPWDFWSPITAGGPLRPLDDTAPVIDELASLMTSDDFDAIRARYETDEQLRVPAEIVTIVDGQPVPATLDL